MDSDPRGPAGVGCAGARRRYRRIDLVLRSRLAVAYPVRPACYLTRWQSPISPGQYAVPSNSAAA